MSALQLGESVASSDAETAIKSGQRRGATGSFRGSRNSYESPAIVPNPFNQYRPTEPPTIVVNSGGNPLSFFCGRSVRGQFKVIPH